MRAFKSHVNYCAFLLSVALVSWGSLGVVCGLPTIADVRVPQPVLDGFEFDATLDFSWSPGSLPPQDATLYCRVTEDGLPVGPVSEAAAYDEGAVVTSEFACGPVKVSKTGYVTIQVEISLSDTFQGTVTETARVRSIPGGVTVLPPIVAVIIAIATRDVLPALFTAVWVAAFFIHWYDPFRGFLRTLDTYIVNALADADHIFIVLFSWCLAGLMGVIQHAGGAQGLANVILKFAKTRRMTMLVCFLCGIVIFFDDYANTLIVGGTFRPIMDSLLISREKLSFLVDATAAPIASISPISSWIGFELGLIDEAYASIKDDGTDLGEQGWETSPFLIFLRTIPGRFYPIAMLALQILLILTQRDFGPMFKAEQRAIKEGKVHADDAAAGQVEITSGKDGIDDNGVKKGAPPRWWNALLPIVLVIFFVLLSLILTGKDAVDGDPELDSSAENIFGNGDSYSALLWSTFFVSIVTWLFYRLQYVSQEGDMQWIWKKDAESKPLMSLNESEDTWINGIKQLVTSTLVLTLAWAIGDAMETLGTDKFIASGVSKNVDKRAIPMLVFILSAAISMATGTSWGTMSIMFPIATKSIFQAAPTDEGLMLSTIASILSGAVFGDHVTPISDTTILSSIASRCDLMHHVRTQAPYAALVGILSIITGDLLSGYLYPTWIGLLITIGAVLVAGYFLSAPPHGDKPDVISSCVDKTGDLLHKVFKNKNDAKTTSDSIGVLKNPLGDDEKKPVAEGNEQPSATDT